MGERSRTESGIISSRIHARERLAGGGCNACNPARAPDGVDELPDPLPCDCLLTFGAVIRRSGFPCGLSAALLWIDGSISVVAAARNPESLTFPVRWGIPKIR